jgi:hypothetical protein
VSKSIILLQFHLEEMADPRLRGTLSACILLTYSIGIMLISLIGTHVSWNMSAGLGVAIALIDLVGYSLLHESPVWLVRNNRIDEARKVFRWLWGSGHHVEVRHTYILYSYRTGETMMEETQLCMFHKLLTLLLKCLSCRCAARENRVKKPSILDCVSGHHSAGAALILQRSASCLNLRLKRIRTYRMIDAECYKQC